MLTPHEGELGRLLEVESSAVERRRLEHAREAARRSGAIVVLKGDDTIVVSGEGDGERLAIKAHVEPGARDRGHRRRLSGTVAALLARGMEPFAATCAAVHAHARAGIEAARGRGAESVIATDVIEALPAGLGRRAAGVGVAPIAPCARSPASTSAPSSATAAACGAPSPPGPSSARS